MNSKYIGNPAEDGIRAAKAENRASAVHTGFCCAVTEWHALEQVERGAHAAYLAAQADAVVAGTDRHSEHIERLHAEWHAIEQARYRLEERNPGCDQHLTDAQVRAHCGGAA